MRGKTSDKEQPRPQQADECEGRVSQALILTVITRFWRILERYGFFTEMSPPPIRTSLRLGARPAELDASALHP